MKRIKLINKVIFIVFLVTSIILTFYALPLPEKDEVITYAKDLEPKIEKIHKDPYIKKFDGVEYRIIPLYEYEAYGVIVEHYNSDNWLDVTHKGDPAQSKDICIVWGDNIKSDIYRQVKYSHGEFTCFVRADTKEIWSKFNQNELTNNHLIPDNKDLKKLMEDTEIGDQVYIRGELVNYEILDEEGDKVRWRTTSNTLEDRLCEVVLVEEYQIIRSTNPLLKHAEEYSFYITGISGLIGIGLFLFT